MSWRPSIPACIRSWWSSGAEVGEIEHLGFVAPRQHVVRRRADLVGQRLATRRGLADLEQEARREDALVLEAVQMDLLDPGQLADRWHAMVALNGGDERGSMMPWPDRARPDIPPPALDMRPTPLPG